MGSLQTNFDYWESSAQHGWVLEVQMWPLRLACLLAEEYVETADSAAEAKLEELAEQGYSGRLAL